MTTRNGSRQHAEQPQPHSRALSATTRWSHAQRQRFGNSRRAFLRTLGGAATALPFFRLLEHSAVHAQAGARPLSFIGVYHPHGAASPLFKRRAEDTEDNFDLTFIEPKSGGQCVLAPFDDPATYGTSFKDKLLVIDGLDFKAGLAGHDAPMSILTGSGQNNVSSSIDQFLAVDQGLGSSTPFSSLVMGVGTVGEGKEYLSFTASGAPLPRMIDPTETFSTVFARLAVMDDPAKAAEAEQARLRGASVLDYLRWDIDRLKPRLAPAEAAKLEQHLTSLRDIEKQLVAFEGTCVAPEAPPAFEQLRRYNGGEPNFEAITNLQVDMLAQAISCGLTNFATLWLADLSSGAVNGTGIQHTAYSEGVDVHNTLAHAYGAPQDGHSGGTGSEGTPASWETLGVQNRYSYGKCARLLQGLAAGGALDDSLVLISTDMGNPNAHSSRDVPIVLAGGAGGKLRMGRYVQLKDNCPPGQYYCDGAELSLIAHNHLLVSIANAFGVETGAFGQAETSADSEGGLAELT